MRISTFSALLGLLALPASLVACGSSDSDATGAANELPVDAGTNGDASSETDAEPGDDGGVADAGDDGGIVLPGAWQEVGAVVAGKKAKRTAIVTTPEGDAVLAIRESDAGPTLRVLRWRGDDTGAWDDLGIANTGVGGSLAPSTDPHGRFVGLAFAGSHIVIAFRQNDAVYANVHDGSSWGTPFVLSADPSAIAVAGDRNRRALVVHRKSGDRVGARFYDATTKAWSDEAIISPSDFTVDDADAFRVEATMTTSGDALVVFRGRKAGQTQTHDVATIRYAAANDTWTAESAGALTDSLHPEQLCLATNDVGAAVVSLREQYTNEHGTFLQGRASYRKAGDSSWGEWVTIGGTVFHDACAISPDGTAFVASHVIVGSSSEIRISRYAGGAWSHGAVVAAKPSTGSSRFVPSMTSGGKAAGAYFRNDSLIRLFRFAPGNGWIASEDLKRTNPYSTSDDQLLKASLLLEDGRFLWVYQDASGDIWYAVNR